MWPLVVFIPLFWVFRFSYLLSFPMSIFVCVYSRKLQTAVDFCFRCVQLQAADLVYSTQTDDFFTYAPMCDGLIRPFSPPTMPSVPEDGTHFSLGVPAQS